MITIVGKPDKFRPVYNPIVFYLNSTNVTEEAFKYNCRLYYGGTTNLICPPITPFTRPIDNYGVLELNAILSSLVSYDINQTLTGSTAAPNTYVKYDLSFGEEYVNYWSFTGKTASGGNLRLIGPTGHGFTTGDSVYVQGSAGTPTVNGVYYVTQTNTTNITIGLSYSSGQSSTGTVRFSDSRKTIFNGLTSSNGYIAFNGTEKHQLLNDWRTSDWDCLVSASPAAKFLTNSPNNYRVRTENNIYLNFYSSDPTSAVDVRVFRDGNISDTVAYTITGSTSSIQTINVGPQNLITRSGDPGLFMTYSTYGVYIANGDSDPITETKYFTIDDTCSRYSNVELYFMDRKGSILPANFELQSYRSEEHQSSRFKKYLGNLSGGKWSFNSTDSGTTTLNTLLTEKLVLNSNWRTEDDINYLKELYSSPVVFIKEYGKLWPCLKSNTDYPILTNLNKKMKSNKIEIEYSNKNSIQSGS